MYRPEYFLGELFDCCRSKGYDNVPLENYKFILSDSVVLQFEAHKMGCPSSDGTFIFACYNTETGELSSNSELLLPKNEARVSRRKMLNKDVYLIRAKSCKRRAIKNLIETERLLNIDQTIWRNTIKDKVKEIHSRDGFEEAWKWNYCYSKQFGAAEMYTYLELYYLSN